MSSIAEVRDAVSVLKVEHKRSDALATAIDTVEKFMMAQPALVQVEEKQARAEQELGRTQSLVKTETARLEEVRADKNGIISETKKEVANIKAAATEEINTAKARAETAKADTARIVADCQAEIQKTRKELEDINRERKALGAKLAS